MLSCSDRPSVYCDEKSDDFEQGKVRHPLLDPKWSSGMSTAMLLFDSQALDAAAAVGSPIQTPPMPLSLGTPLVGQASIHPNPRPHPHTWPPEHERLL